jgi:hypothetical protein
VSDYRTWFVVAALLTAAQASGSTLERLLMPGPVAQAHAKLEDDCAKCHDPKDRKQQTGLCLDCHKDVRADLSQQRGFHGHALKPGAPCQSCHSEHKGRGADIVRLDRESFDHGLTGYPLTGRHVGVACAACHSPKKKLREAPTACADCHAKDDVHRGKLGRDCAGCHATSAWGTVKFDHSKTRFPLLGAHDKVACVSCHRDPAFKGAPLACASCHARDDVHKGGRGPECQSCHNTVRWKESRFDHEKVGHFALNGRHASISCDACHRSGDMKVEIPKTCIGCHAADDRHTGRFGTDCALCHNESKWKDAKYDHERQAHFALRGAHAKLDCNACHKIDAKTAKLAHECYACHQADDVHAGAMGKDCGTCHVESGWKDKVSFDHDLTRFPLVGLHASVACEECHPSRAYRGTPRDCISCHGPDDVHKGTLGKTCQSCHNPNGWKFWQFDHGQQTRAHFALTGAHAKIECKACHVQSPDQVRLPTECGACHRRDDVHQRRFGGDCGRCHNTKAWAQPRVGQ